MISRANSPKAVAMDGTVQYGGAFGQRARGSPQAGGPVSWPAWDDPGRNADDDAHFMQTLNGGPGRGSAIAHNTQMAGNPRERAQKQMGEKDAVQEAYAAYKSMASVLFERQDTEARRGLQRGRRTVYCFSVCAAIWAVLCMTCLFVFPLLYWHSTVGVAQERFLVSVAKRVEAQAIMSLSTAFAARDVVHYVVQRRLYFEPSGYASVMAALEPLFTSQPQLRAVELAFLGRHESLVVRRVLSGSELGGAPELVMQSDVADCREALGNAGCIAGVPASRQDWAGLAAALPCGLEECEGVGQPSGENNFQWTDGPGFVAWDYVEHPVEQSATSDGAVHWAPAYSMLFKTDFPGSGGNLSAIGRATLDISHLRLNLDLEHDTLGSQGGIFLCDRGGVILASASLEQSCKIEAPMGHVRFRRAWELEHEWAAQLVENDFIAGRQFSLGSVHVCVTPLTRDGLEHFSVLVAAERDGVQDDKIMDLSFWCELLAVFPFALGVCTIAPVFANKAYRNFKRATALGKFRHYLRRSSIWVGLVNRRASQTSSAGSDMNSPRDLDESFALPAVRAKTLATRPARK